MRDSAITWAYADVVFYGESSVDDIKKAVNIQVNEMSKCDHIHADSRTSDTYVYIVSIFRKLKAMRHEYTN